MMWELFALWPTPLGSLWTPMVHVWAWLGLLTPPWDRGWEVRVDHCSHGSSPNMRGSAFLVFL